MKLNTLALAIIIASAGSLTLSSCSTNDQKSQDKPTMDESLTDTAAAQQLDIVIDKATLEFLEQQPTLSTMLALEPDAAGGSYNDRFPDYSVAGMAKMQSTMGDAAAKLQAINSDKLSPEQQYHQQILINIFDYFRGDVSFPGGYIDTWAGHLPYIINQISGPLIDAPKLMQVQQSVTSKQEAQDYVTRLDRMGDFVDGVIAKYRADMENGIVLPKKLHPKTLDFFDAFLASDPADHELVRSFAEKLAKIDDITDEDRAQLIGDVTDKVATVVYPAYQRARDLMTLSESKARDGDGIWAQPGGDEFYRHEIRFLGDSTLTPAQIHQLGLDEVERISTEMDSLLSANGFTEGSVGERMIELGKQDGQVYPATDEGRADLLNYLNGEIKKVMAKAPQFYGTIPDQAVEVRRIPPVTEAGEAGGFYTPPSLDGTRPGIYWINLRDMEAVAKFGLKTLTYHEAVPGHHFQIALNMAQDDIGLMRQNAPYNAYVEGWALYSEYLASTKLGMYDDDPFGDLGRLQAELYRAVRLVVDTGLHDKHWTREQAIDYFHATAGSPLSDVVPEVERYMAWPGQALGYKLGMLMFVKLEREAEAALGDDFDIREFHDIILLPGARPMAMVKDDVERWIKDKRG